MATNRYFNNTGLSVTDGILAKAAQLNSFIQECNTAFELVESEVDTALAAGTTAFKWANNDQGELIDAINNPTDYSSKANALEAKAWASGEGGVDTEADGVTPITRSAKEYSEDTAADVATTSTNVALTNADVVLTNADVVLANASAVEAGGYATDASNTLDEFQDSYLGAYASEPVGSFITGAMYWNTTTNSSWIYNGSEFVESSGFGTMKVFEFNLTQDQTVVSGLDNNSNSLALQDDNFIVYLNGRRLDSTDYTYTPSSVTLLSSADLDDVLSITSWEIVTYVEIEDVLSAVDDAEDYSLLAYDYSVSAGESEVQAENWKDLAYQYSLDAQSVACQDLASIQDTLLTSSDIVDVFIYDTSEDSDGGAWRDRCADLSWYKETLNTATRGSQRKFPKVALIIAESDTVTIYDAHTLDMWMVFTSNIVSSTEYSFLVSGHLRNIYIKNGRLSVGRLSLLVCDFLTDSMEYGTESILHDYKAATINRRNETISGLPLSDATSEGARKLIPNVIIKTIVNDVAMTVLDKAPIDQTTGLPVPTIAVATGGGVSVIDGPAGVGTVVNITYVSGFGTCSIDGDRLFASNLTTPYISFGAIPLVDSTHTSWRDGYYGYDPASSLSLLDGVPTNCIVGNSSSSSGGLSLLKENPMSPSDGMVAYITDQYNTGWMKGDIKLATLADTTEEIVGDDVSTELVTNGTFDDTSGWTVTNGVISGGEGHYDNITAYTEAFRQNPVFDSNATYIISVDVTRNTNSNGVLYYTGSLSLPLLTTGTHTFTVKGINRLVFTATSSTNGISVDNVSVKRVQNLVENGEFSSDRAWTKGTGWAISGGVATHTGTSFTYITSTNSNYIVGKKYSVILDVVIPSGSAFLYYGSSGEYYTISTTGTHKFTFEAIGSVINIGTSVDGFSISNIQVYELLEPDRSVNDNPLQVVGQVQKIPVNTGCDLVAYSGFSSDNYLEQPYNSDLDFGTGDFYTCGWWKPNVVGSLPMISKGVSTRALTLLATSTDVRLYLAGTLRLSATYITPTEYAFYAAWRDGINIYIAINGTVVATSTANDNTDVTDATLQLGKEHGGLVGTGVSMALWRMGAGSLSAEQIRQMYDDEKKLFEENTTCTIGDSNVTALSYDEKTKILNVGTSTSVDTIQGLANVANSVISDSNIVALSSLDERVLIGSDTKVSYYAPPVLLRDTLVKKDAQLAIAKSSPVSLISSGAGQTQVKCDLGYKPTMVYDAGLLVPFTITYDGYYYYVNITSSTGDVTIMQRRV